MSLLFADLTSLTKSHLESLMVLSGRYHVMGFAEHKVTEDRIESVQAHFSAMEHKADIKRDLKMKEFCRVLKSVFE